MATISPIAAISQLTKLNKSASTIIVSAIAIFAAISIITNFNIDIKTSILVAAYIIGIGTVLIIIANIIDDRVTKYIIGYTLTVCFCVVAVCFVVSALFRDQGIINPTYCLVRFWERCNVIEDRVAELNSQAIDSKNEIPQVISGNNAGVTSSNYKVFIQFAGLITRESIQDLNAALKAGGWRVQSDSGERIRSAAGINEIRYKTGEDKAAAEALAKAISASRIASVPLAVKQVSLVDTGTLEVWISN
ncbi:hypothetical protein [Agrobacterium bohemicum]|uniref:Uncharacterized protein n=1 Tax=Agrobacterium bohemicum TaxID=2052828 RepID=A0A135P843_9HYPH|nr:hypothetical protein [Agrobacterium bohemicum]KXG87597.1 hypothetical protein ATO67_18290 [Agrobacterium bohemicum]